jgi:hypothetical protein
MSTQFVQLDWQMCHDMRSKKRRPLATAKQMVTCLFTVVCESLVTQWFSVNRDETWSLPCQWLFAAKHTAGLVITRTVADPHAYNPISA